jgi:hypothetical protein
MSAPKADHTPIARKPLVKNDPRLRDHYAGEVKRSRNRISGTLVVLIDLAKPEAEWAGSMDDGGRWLLLCDDHSSLVQTTTRQNAEYHMPDPDWCPICSGIDPEEEHHERVGEALDAR